MHVGVWTGRDFRSKQIETAKLHDIVVNFNEQSLWVFSYLLTKIKLFVFLEKKNLTKKAIRRRWLKLKSNERCQILYTCKTADYVFHGLCWQAIFYSSASNFIKLSISGISLRLRPLYFVITG